MKLLAKSVNDDNCDDSEFLTLCGHLELGILAAQQLKSIAPLICERLGLDITPQALVRTVMLGIWIHDWGKVSQDFQSFVQNRSDKNLLRQKFGISSHNLLPLKQNQAIRHELFSVILMRRKYVWEWLKSATDVDLSFALMGVLGHHLKVKDISYFEKNIPGGIQNFVEHQDFQQVLRLGVKYFGLSEDLPKLSQKEFTREEVTKAQQCIKEQCAKFEQKCAGADSYQLKNVAVVKALVMSADLAASALLEKERGQRTYVQWIRAALKEVLTEEELKKVIKARLQCQPLRPFQQQEAEYSSRVLIVIAGCGVGKTLVPFLRFKRLVAMGKSIKMFFCYPTTATTSQGFEDYGLTLEEKALLSHSRFEVDYELKGFSNTYDDESDKDDKLESFQTKVEALKLWHSKLIFCTAHVVLGLMQNHRKGLYGFPSIACGAFVFDEIHAYPPELFGTLLEFLRVFRQAPIVLMSASLPPARLQAIQTVLAETGETADVLRGPAEIESLPRYQLVACEETAAWARAIDHLHQGGKVLWITNQVADAQHLYAEAAEKLPAAGISVPPLLYHARFRYQDAIRQHEQLVKAFRSNQPAFAVTTQIAEMSLDISCTLLISATAPMSSLVQRLGRLNRWVKITPNGNYELETGGICPALIYPWEKELPYKPEDLETGKQLLRNLAGKTISQMDLAAAIDSLSAEPPSPKRSTWLSTWLTEQDGLMPAAYTIQGILEDDVAKIMATAQQSGEKPFLEAQKWVVSVRITKNTPNWSRTKALRFYPIIPTQEYCYHPEIGAYTTSDTLLQHRYGHQT